LSLSAQSECGQSSYNGKRQRSAARVLGSGEHVADFSGADVAAWMWRHLQP
jgi:hypothetical protein